MDDCCEDDVERTVMDSSADNQSSRYEAMVDEVARDCYATLSYEEVCSLRDRPRPVVYHLTLGKIIRSTYSRYFDEAHIPYQRDRMSMDVMMALVPYALPEYNEFSLCYPLFNYESFCDLDAYRRMGLHPRHFECLAENYHLLEEADTMSAGNPYDRKTQQRLWSTYQDTVEQRLVTFMTNMAQDLWDFPSVKQRCREYGIHDAIVDDFECHCMKTMLNGRWHGGRVLPSRLACVRTKMPLRGDDLDASIRPLIWFLENSPGNDDVLRDVLFDDHDICQLLATHAGRLLRRMPRYQNDYPIVSAAVAQFPDAIKWASARLQEDPKILALAARNAHQTFIFSNPVMKSHCDDDALAMMAVTANGANIAYVSKRLRADKPLAILALRNITDFAPFAAFESLSDELKADKELALLTVRSGHVDIDTFPESLRDDDDIAQLLADSSENRWQLTHMSERVRKKFGALAQHQ